MSCQHCGSPRLKSIDWAFECGSQDSGRYPYQSNKCQLRSSIQQLETERDALQNRVTTLQVLWDQRWQMMRELEAVCGTEDVAKAVEYIKGLKARVKRLEEALGLVLKMHNDWLEMQEDGYAGAYYAFVKGNDHEWDSIIKAKESKL